MDFLTSSRYSESWQQIDYTGLQKILRPFEESKLFSFASMLSIPASIFLSGLNFTVLAHFHIFGSKFTNSSFLIKDLTLIFLSEKGINSSVVYTHTHTQKKSNIWSRRYHTLMWEITEISKHLKFFTVKLTLILEKCKTTFKNRFNFLFSKWKRHWSFHGQLVLGLLPDFVKSAILWCSN